MKRYLAFMGAAMFFVACFSLYLMMESVAYSNKGLGVDMDGMSNIETKIKQIETDLARNHKTINLIKDTVRDFAKDGNKESWDKLLEVVKDEGLLGDKLGSQRHPVGGLIHMQQNITGPRVKHQNLQLSQAMCSFAEQPSMKSDINMFDVFQKLPFDNPDGGVWKQGFPLSYSPTQWETTPLKVFVIPHSHCDPGWLKTFERYYTEQARSILNNMVDKLEAYPKMKFIYAEMSFFSLWWSEIDEGKRNRVKRLLEDGRFEIVTGGWVMTDEANAHYFAMLDQMIEGNQWLLNQVGVKPKSAWSIDPFGQSPTMPYLLKGMGFKNTLIQRIHYSVKKYLAQSKHLEFMWRQNWDHTGDTDILSHMMPFYSYDVPHTCGPDPAVCCQFDFKRLPGGKISCPWKIPPVVINDQNVQQRAEMLLDQYRKKSRIYQNDIVLIPLGDDFRYDKTNEWDQQYLNYQKLFDYMNNRADWNVEAKFGTLSDYFNALHERAGSQPGQAPPNYPVLSGDFFTYADRDDHYWSGYFTSRPFYKRLDRELEAHLRGGEILYSLAVSMARYLRVNVFPEEQLMKNIVNARRNLGLYQHHDGITGTAKDAVVVDYGNKMLGAMRDMKNVMVASSQFLISEKKESYSYSESSPVFDVDETRDSHDSLPERTVLKLSEQERFVLFYNSLAQTRTVTVHLYVTEQHAEVKDSEGNVVSSQCDPYWLGNTAEMSSIKFKLVFAVTVPALGLSRYTVRSVPASSNPSHAIASVAFYNEPPHTVSPLQSQTFEVTREKASNIFIENSEMKAKISTVTGTVQEITLRENGRTVKSSVNFLLYGVKNQKEKSGAYLFLPDGEAKPVEYNKPFVRVIRGPVSTEVHSMIPYVEHSISLYNSPGLDSLSMDIYNLVDIRQLGNKEITMRIETDVTNRDDTFYTDLNGFQIQKRKTFSKLPLQANFYPMPSMAYLENDEMRFTILSGQSLGCASLKPGWLEVMQDRRLSQDDNRGLGQGVTDNKRTPNRFRILVEKRTPGAKPLPSEPVGYPSLVAHLSSQEFIYPVMIFPQSPSSPDLSLFPVYQPLSHDLSCDLHVVNLRTMQNPENNGDLRFKPRDPLGLLLHRLGIDCTFPAKGLVCPVEDGKVNFSTLLKGLTVTVTPTSLSLIHDDPSPQSSAIIEIPPMHIKAYKIIIK